jgi:hypothetical protein
MKKVLFFFLLSVFLTSCNTYGFIGKGSGPATKEKKVAVPRVYVQTKKIDKPKTIVSNKYVNKNGLRSNLGAKPPKATASHAKFN